LISCLASRGSSLHNLSLTRVISRDPGIHTKRQPTRHGCLPSLLGYGDKKLKYLYDEEKNICTVEQPRQNKNLWYRHEKPNKPTKEGPISFVLFESPFTSVSTVSSVHSSLDFLVKSLGRRILISSFASRMASYNPTYIIYLC
jgi:hypothetical protein